jgi:hypothetical protein
MEPLWTTEREDSFDLKQFARRILDSAIENLERDGELQSAVFVVNSSEIHCVEVSFAGQEEKEQIYSRIVQYARHIGAEAIVTLNDAYWGEPEMAVDYYPGKLKVAGSKECIHISVSGPLLTNWSIEAKYEKREGRFHFHLPDEETGGSIGFLGDWPSNIKSVN